MSNQQTVHEIESAIQELRHGLALLALAAIDTDDKPAQHLVLEIDRLIGKNFDHFAARIAARDWIGPLCDQPVFPHDEAYARGVRESKESLLQQYIWYWRAWEVDFKLARAAVRHILAQP